MITTTYFCAICQAPFHGESAKGGRRFCARHRQHAGKSVRSLLLHIADQEHKLELRDADSARLAARVAELEERLVGLSPEYVAWLQSKSSEVPGLTATLDEARGLIADLQSQLAWTPVSAGLPTEPGEGEKYEFLSACGRIYLLALHGEIWLDRDGDCLDEDDVAEDYTHYRCIELPKDGES